MDVSIRVKGHVVTWMSLPSCPFYPAATVGLSVLRERVMRIQAIGILLVLLAIPLISA